MKLKKLINSDGDCQWRRKVLPFEESAEIITVN